MKIAVTTENNQVFQHFGQSRRFSVYSAEDGKIVGKTVLEAGENGHGALAGLLRDSGVEVLICGGIGDGAKRMLASCGIQLISGITGTADEAVETYLAGRLKDMGTTCDHHDHSHGGGSAHECSCHDHGI